MKRKTEITIGIIILTLLIQASFVTIVYGARILNVTMEPGNVIVRGVSQKSIRGIESSNPEVATGRVYLDIADNTAVEISAHSPGKAEIKVYYAGETDIYNVSVEKTDSPQQPPDSDQGEPDGEEQTVPVEAVRLDRNRLVLAQGERFKLEATVNPENATNKRVTWSSNSPLYADVRDNDGWVTAINPGTSTITVTTHDGGKTASCVVEVKIPVQEIRITGETYAVPYGGTIEFDAIIKPGDATDKKVSWSSEPPTKEALKLFNKEAGKASVDGMGRVFGAAPGLVTIVAESSCNRNIKDSILITVEESKDFSTLSVPDEKTALFIQLPSVSGLPYFNKVTVLPSYKGDIEKVMSAEWYYEHTVEGQKLYDDMMRIDHYVNKSLEFIPFYGYYNGLKSAGRALKNYYEGNNAIATYEAYQAFKSITGELLPGPPFVMTALLHGQDMLTGEFIYDEEKRRRNHLHKLDEDRKAREYFRRLDAQKQEH